MAKNNNLGDFLTDLADTLRTKKGTTDLINPQDFSSEILSIAGGIEDVATSSEMDAKLAEANVGKIYRYTGTTGDYVNGDLYEVAEEEEPPTPSGFTVTLHDLGSNEYTNYYRVNDGEQQVWTGNDTVLTDVVKLEIYASTGDVTYYNINGGEHHYLDYEQWTDITADLVDNCIVGLWFDD